MYFYLYSTDDGASADKGSDEGDPFDNYFHFEDEDFDVSLTFFATS